jgi:hypothetical protein
MHGATEHLKQKYMGLGRQAHEHNYNEETQVHIDDTGKAGHGLPLTNFLNAQCTCPSLDVD